MTSDSISHPAVPIAKVGNLPSGVSLRAGGRWRDFPECLFVGGIWLVMALGLLRWVMKYGGGLPYMDDWYYLDGLCRVPPSLHWIVSQIAEARAPLAKVAMWCVWQAGGGRVVVGAFVNALALIGSALALIAAARFLRGRLAYSDAIFPLLLLNWSVARVFFWFMMIYIFLGVALFYAFQTAAARGLNRGRLPLIVACACALTMSVYSSVGMLFSLPLAVFMGFLGWRNIRDGDPHLRRNGIALLITAVLIPIAVGVQFIGWTTHASAAVGERGLAAKFSVMLQAAGLGFGLVGARPAWIPPWSLGALLLALTAAGAWRALRIWQTGRELPERVIMMVGCLAAAWAFPFAIGISRSTDAMSYCWYCPMAAGVIDALYLVWCLKGRSAAGRFVQMSLFTLVCGLAMYQMVDGANAGIGRRKAVDAFDHDVAAGIPLTGLVARHVEYWGWSEASFRHGLQLLQQAGVERFRGIRPDPTWEVRKLGLPPVAATGDATGSSRPHGSSQPPLWEFPLSHPENVVAVRLQFAPDLSLHATCGFASFSVLWPASDHTQERDREDCQARIIPSEGGSTRTVWIDKKIDRFWIAPDPDFPMSFLRGVEILVNP